MCGDGDNDSEDREILRLLGDWLARWRARVGVSQRVLADRAGINQGGLSRVERGLQACGSRRLGRLIVALDDLSDRTPMGRVEPPPIRPGRSSPGRWTEPDITPEGKDRFVIEPEHEGWLDIRPDPYGDLAPP